VGTGNAKRPLGKRLVSLYEWWRHPQATLAGWPPAPSNSVMYLSGSKYLLLESERANGTQAATPMWFAAIDERVVLRTEAGSLKVRRISKQPIVKAAACRMRGKPVGGGYLECMARIVPPEREGEAEAALRRGYGLLRRLFNLVVRNDHTYLELTPLTAEEPVPEDEAQAAAVRAIHEGRREQQPPPAGAA
jgi:PPOX class probable F420-dependent enzyme